VKTLWQTPLVAIAAAIALVAGCSQQNVYQPPPPPSVTVSKPVQQDVTIYLDETGTTEPFQYVDIRARVKGFLVSEPELLGILERELMTILSKPEVEGDDESNAELMTILQQRLARGGGDEASDGDLIELLQKRAPTPGDIAIGKGPDVSEVWLLRTLKEKAAREKSRADDPQYPKDEVSKEYLKENYFLPSTDVKAGDQLYQIDPQPFLATLRQAVAALNVANAEYIDADAKYKRGIPLVDSGAMSKEEFGERVADRGVKRAVIKAAEAAVRTAKLDLDYTRVAAPFDGRVGKTLVYKGNLVGATEATLLTNIVRYDPIYATFNISENELLRIQAAREKAEARGETADKKGSKEPSEVFMRRANDTAYKFQGQLDYTALTVDERTGTFQVRGVFPNPDNKIVPGLFVRIRVPLGTVPNALLIPQRAVAQDQQGKYLLVIDKDNKVERRDVALGRTVRDFVVVAEGLQADETVIIDGIQRARAGAKVTPEPIVLDPPAPEVIEPESDEAADALPSTPEATRQPSLSPAARTPPESPGGAVAEPPRVPAETSGGAPGETPGGTSPESPAGPGTTPN
jgi:RND family efflux transporter MFP subunit